MIYGGDDIREEKWMICDLARSNPSLVSESPFCLILALCHSCLAEGDSVAKSPNGLPVGTAASPHSLEVDRESET